MNVRRVPLALRLFLTVLLTTLVIATISLGVLHWTMQKNFAKYVADVEMQKLDHLIDNLAGVYSTYHDWGNAIQAQILRLLADLQDELGIAMVLITHDLGVIAGIADRVMVMYGGQVVEQGPVKDLFANPRHPYTRALLKTIPSISGARDARLQVIEGQPPILNDAPTACPFRARCGHAMAICEAENPARRAIDGAPLGHGHDVEAIRIPVLFGSAFAHRREFKRMGRQ